MSGVYLNIFAFVIHAIVNSFGNGLSILTGTLTMHRRHSEYLSKHELIESGTRRFSVKRKEEISIHVPTDCEALIQKINRFLGAHISLKYTSNRSKDIRMCEKWD